MDQNQIQQESVRPERGQADWSTQGRQGRQDAPQMPGDRGLQTTAEVALRGAAMLWDLQMETARNLMRTHARTAAMLGVPDYSEFFRVGDEHARRIMSISAEQVLNSARQARDTVVEVQRHLGRLAEQQVTGLTEEVRKQIEQMGRQTEQRLQELRQLAVTQADQVNHATRQAIDAVAQVRRQGEGLPEQGIVHDQQTAKAGTQGRSAGQPQTQPVAQREERSELWVPPSATEVEAPPQNASGGQAPVLQAAEGQQESASALILPETTESSAESTGAKPEGQNRDLNGRATDDRPRSRRSSV